jgi:hypothetical protein
MKILPVALALSLVISSFAADEMYTGAYWETFVSAIGDTKGGGAIDLNLSGTNGTSGPLEIKAFDRHIPQTFTGTWFLVRNSDTNLVKFVITNSYVDWRGTINRKKGQVTGTWNNLPINKGKFQATTWAGLVEE